MMKQIWIAATLCVGLLNQPTIADAAKHPEHDAIMATIDGFFKAINTNDLALMRSLAMSDAMNYSVTILPDGSTQVHPYTQEYFLDPKNLGPEKLTERYWDPKLMIHKGIAVFWAPYDFYIDGKFSHCGIDAFDLIKVDGMWKVGNASWTRERDKATCALHPDGPPPEAQ